MKKLSIVIGRFSPFHIGHEKMLLRAINDSDCTLVLLGSAHRATTSKDPWTYYERKHLIAGALADCDIDPSKVFYKPLRDHMYSDADWFAEVQEHVGNFVRDIGSCQITLHGVGKDNATNYYLQMFPQWENAVSYDIVNVVNATDLRSMIFEGQEYWEAYVPDSVRTYILNWIKTPEGIRAKEEYLFIKNYKETTQVGKYPPIFSTVDAVVFYKGHVLLVERGAMPGKGLLALPGGFVNQEERLLDAAIREASEETRFIIQKEWLIGSFVADAPQRSLRGRTISYCFAFKIPDDYKFNNYNGLPFVEGADDAKSAHWRAMTDVRKDLEERIFEDHLCIINTLYKLVK